MIDLTQQKEIASTIKALVTTSHLDPEAAAERQQLLFIGVMVALGPDLPPYWLINIQSGRTDRIIADYAS